MDALAVISDVTEVSGGLGGVLDDFEDLVVLDVVDEGLGVVDTLENVVEAGLGLSMNLGVDNLLDLADAESLAGSVNDTLELVDEAGELLDNLEDVVSVDVIGDVLGVSDGSFESADAARVLLEGAGDAKGEDEGDGGLHFDFFVFI